MGVLLLFPLPGAAVIEIKKCMKFLSAEFEFYAKIWGGTQVFAGEENFSEILAQNLIFSLDFLRIWSPRPGQRLGGRCGNLDFCSKNAKFSIFSKSVFGVRDASKASVQVFL